MVLFASAVDALVWSYQAQRAALERQDTFVRARPCRAHRAAATETAPAPAQPEIRTAPALVSPRPARLADE